MKQELEQQQQQEQEQERQEQQEQRQNNCPTYTGCAGKAAVHEAKEGEVVVDAANDNGRVPAQRRNQHLESVIAR
jgi:hypothetical protein